MSNKDPEVSNKRTGRPINTNKKIPLQRYWTSRYVLTLVIGLIIVAFISAFWIRHTTFEDRIDMMQFMAQETAKQIVEGNQTADEDNLMQNYEVRRFLEEPGRYMQIKSDPSIFIVNIKGDVIYSNASEKNLHQQLNPDLLYREDDVESFYSEGEAETLYMVKAPVKTEGKLAGWVVFFEFKSNLTEVNQEYKQLFVMISALALLGWLAIYFLSKQLAKPITDVAAAAERVKEGDYELAISEDVKEKEVYELIRSFKEMAGKLEKLEKMRTELLAGVTHELKTPVTSISGLLQALKDGVVEGEEAEEFLNISLKETAKMKKMVEDLLAFNSFVANAVPLQKERIDLNQIVPEMIRDWEVTQQTSVHIMMDNQITSAIVDVDTIRLQQILMNLFNNALHAMMEKEDRNLAITLSTSEDNSAVYIDIADNGIGILVEEQPFIFERFYRGEEKKFKTSGFGLGLPFSKMIAQALDGDLVLLESSSEGTSFRLSLPLVDHEQRKVSKKSF